jgi:tetratricopeptide (TPR) repeat protein
VDRTAAHRAAAEWLEDQGEADAAVLARHLERGGLAGRAATMYLDAAHQSMARCDLETAILRSEEGLRCGAAGELRVKLLIVKGQALVWTGRAADAQVVLLEAKSQVDDEGPLWPAVLASLASAATRTGSQELLISSAEAIATAKSTPEHRLVLIRAMQGVVINLTQAGRTDLGARIEARVQRWAAGSPDPAVDLELRQIRAWRAIAQGDSADFVRVIEPIIEVLDGSGDTPNALRSRLNLGFAWTQLGQHERALAVLRHVQDDALRVGMVHLHATATQNSGLALSRLGRFEEARAVLDRSTASFERIDDLGYASSSRLYRAQLELECGWLEPAEREARAALQGLGPFPPATALARATLARVLLRQGRTAEALELARAGQEALDRIGEMEEGQSYIRLALIECLDSAGRSAEADELLRVAHDWLQSRAAKMEEPLQRSYLANVPENATIVRLARRIDTSRAPP